MIQHGILPWPTPAELGTAETEVYSAITGGPRAAGPQHFRISDPEGRLEGPFNAMVLAPSVGGPLQQLGAAIRYRTSLSDRQREVAILAAAAAEVSEFEWYAHEAIARACGLADQDLAAIYDGRDAAGLDYTEQLVLRATRTLVANRALETSLANECRDHLGLPGFIELVVLVGYNQTLDLILRVFQTPLPEGVARQFEGVGTSGD